MPKRIVSPLVAVHAPVAGKRIVLGIKLVIALVERGVQAARHAGESDRRRAAIDGSRLTVAPCIGVINTSPAVPVPRTSMAFAAESPVNTRVPSKLLTEAKTLPANVCRLSNDSNLNVLRPKRENLMDPLPSCGILAIASHLPTLPLCRGLNPDWHPAPTRTGGKTGKTHAGTIKVFTELINRIPT